MRATEFEFRYRFWFICLAYFVGFGFYTLDHTNLVVALAQWIFRGSDPHLNSLAAGHVIHGLFVLSATLVTAAAFIRTWGGAYLRTEVVHDSAVHTERLVADGPYRHLRNPLYFGNMLLAVGMAMMASRIGALVIVLGNLLIVLRLIGREEADLAQAQGEGYRAFLAAVPRLWPSAPAPPARRRHATEMVPGIPGRSVDVDFRSRRFPFCLQVEFSSLLQGPLGLRNRILCNVDDARSFPSSELDARCPCPVTPTILIVRKRSAELFFRSAARPICASSSRLGKENPRTYKTGPRYIRLPSGSPCGNLLSGDLAAH